MLRDVLERFDCCFACDPTRVDGALALECVVSLCEANVQDQAIIMAYARHGLLALGHPEPRAWCLAVALQALSRAVGQAPLDRRGLRQGLGLVVRLMCLYDPLGSVWSLARVNRRGALIQAQSSIAPGSYAVASASGRVEALDYRVPSVELWWKSGGVVWVCTGMTRKPKGGMFAAHTHEASDVMALVGALLGLSRRRDGAHPGLATQVRAWSVAHNRRGRGVVSEESAGR